MHMITRKRRDIFMAVAHEIEKKYMDYLDGINNKTYLVQPDWKDVTMLESIGYCYNWNWRDLPVRLKKKNAKPQRLQFLADNIFVFDMEADREVNIPLYNYVKGLKWETAVNG